MKTDTRSMNLINKWMDKGLIIDISKLMALLYIYIILTITVFIYPSFVGIETANETNAQNAKYSPKRKRSVLHKIMNTVKNVYL